MTRSPDRARRWLFLSAYVVIVVWAVALISSAVPLRADTLFNSDWSTPGDGLLLNDANTGLQWLNLSLGYGFCNYPGLPPGTVANLGYYALVQETQDPSSPIYGFSVATTQQVTQLLVDAGMTPVPPDDPAGVAANHPAGYILASMLGANYWTQGETQVPMGIAHPTAQWWNETTLTVASSTLNILSLDFTTNTATDTSYVDGVQNVADGTADFWLTTESGPAWVDWALVRPMSSAVPAPSLPLSLLSLGSIAGVLGWCRRRGGRVARGLKELTHMLGSSARGVSPPPRHPPGSPPWPPVTS